MAAIGVERGVGGRRGWIAGTLAVRVDSEHGGYRSASRGRPPSDGAQYRRPSRGVQRHQPSAARRDLEEWAIWEGWGFHPKNDFYTPPPITLYCGSNSKMCTGFFFAKECSFFKMKAKPQPQHRSMHVAFFIRNST
jgi:hypothetical protein